MEPASPSVARRIAETLKPREGESRLDVLVLLVAEIEYPGLDTDLCLQKLDELAGRVRPTAAEAARPGPLGIISAINRCLFEQEGFCGNTTDYYDPRNSFLNDVLDRRTGIPITLSVVYIEVARRLGFTFEGVGLPGHFLVRSVGPPDVLVDPFYAGRILTEADCQERLREIHGPEMRLEPAFLEPVHYKYIVTRMLNNLRAIYQTTREYRKVIAILDVLLEIYPRSAEEYKQRGVLHHLLKNYSAALADLEKYLEAAADPSDADDIRQNIVALKRLLASLN